MPYAVTIIDTPGFGGTEGLRRDMEITLQIKEFFSLHLMVLTTLALDLLSSPPRPVSLRHRSTSLIPFCPYLEMTFPETYS